MGVDRRDSWLYGLRQVNGAAGVHGVWVGGWWFVSPVDGSPTSRRFRNGEFMPSKSRKQSRLMNAACHNPKVARSSGVPRKVACEYARADKRRKR